VKCAIIASLLLLVPGDPAQTGGHGTRATQKWIFEDYPVVANFRGTPAKPQIVTPLENTYRTQIQTQAGKGPNFAGHFTLAKWGCGSPCAAFVIIDALSGTVYAPGLTVGCSDKSGIEAKIDFKLTSRLVVTTGFSKEVGCGTDFREWDGKGLSLIHFEPWHASGPKASRRELKISDRNIDILEHIGDYSDLEMLSIGCLEKLQSVPISVGGLTRLKELTIAEGHGNGCSMNPLLPENIGNLRSLEKLILYSAQDPRQPHHQIAERHRFPTSMSQLKNVTYLDLGGNGLDEIPAFVKDLPKLKELGFEFNELKEIPAFLSNLRGLTTLRLSGNRLSDLPDFLRTLPRLTRVTLGNNCKITQDAVRMKNLKRRFPRVTFDFADEYDCPPN
jgi:hypothetical protein